MVDNIRPIRPDVLVGTGEPINPVNPNIAKGKAYLLKSFTIENDEPFYTIAGVKDARLGRLMREVYADLTKPDGESDRLPDVWFERIYIAHRAAEIYRTEREKYVDEPLDSEAIDEMRMIIHPMIFNTDERSREVWRDLVDRYDNLNSAL